MAVEVFVCGLCRGFNDCGLDVEFDCPHCGKTHSGSVAEDASPPICVRPKCGGRVTMQYMLFDRKKPERN